ncbi:1-acyl-sn-glycerol-3-phosphate acyltransferase [Flavobacterium agricola]|uniref:1-acyl-sn-glycerol-3-phosphate acyltransferase n=1 Tax=Flavobacterium agricola TaxID=2870839 RepID=A0ABY6LW94_9FLAO|nr:1-acyl-sn-glycerol-3-phosphate acyltransferase [Flavobacterium agricola]UYW00436.1 1-acyl-sn-glycerol-3-phosphate acyltransferase [Flavobacterium agricola]
MLRIIGKFLFFLGGWKIKNNLDLSRIDKCVLVCAPHTSNWDFYYTVIAFWQMGIPYKLFIKDAWTKPWYGYFIKKLGGIGVDRSQRNNMVDFAASLLKNNSKMYLLNTPEGTRGYAEKWKKGFYYIAQQAEVPILLAFCDYEKKEAGIKAEITIANKSLEEVFQEIEAHYQDVTAKYPELFNKKIY